MPIVEYPSVDLESMHEWRKPSHLQYIIHVAQNASRNMLEDVQTLSLVRTGI